MRSVGQGFLDGAGEEGAVEPADEGGGVFGGLDLAELGGDVHLGVPVAEVMHTAGRASGIRLADGRSITARRALRAPAPGDWKQAALDKMTSLVAVRRVGSEALADPGPEGALARAEAALARDDLAAAAVALGALSADAVLGGWMSDAKRRLEAERHLGEMSARAIALSSAHMTAK